MPLSQKNFASRLGFRARRRPMGFYFKSRRQKFSHGRPRGQASPRRLGTRFSISPTATLFVGNTFGHASPRCSTCRQPTPFLRLLPFIWPTKSPCGRILCASKGCSLYRTNKFHSGLLLTLFSVSCNMTTSAAQSRVGAPYSTTASIPNTWFLRLLVVFAG